jgi:glycine cleavage system H protein
MTDKKYSREHEWIKLEGEVATIGISNYAQEQMGDVVFVELPAVETTLEAGSEAAVVESVKAASEVYAPVSGEVIEINGELEENPGAVNEDAEGEGWFMKIQLDDLNELEQLMDAEAYAAYVASLD